MVFFVCFPSPLRNQWPRTQFAAYIVQIRHVKIMHRFFVCVSIKIQRETKKVCHQKIALLQK